MKEKNKWRSPPIVCLFRLDLSKKCMLESVCVQIEWVLAIPPSQLYIATPCEISY